MPIPSTIETAKEHLFSSVDEMTANGIPKIIQERLIRLRDMYNLWLQFPRKSDLEIVSTLQKRYDIKRSQAYEDVRIIKTLLGELNKSTKDYNRYKFSNMIDRTFDMAERIKDARAMGAAANYLGKYMQLDKEEARDRGYDKIIPQTFEPTDDPSSLGIKPIPNIREKIRDKIKQYWTDDIEDVKFEEAEFNEDDIFKVKPIVGDETVL